jgi:hypothetical protein
MEHDPHRHQAGKSPTSPGLMLIQQPRAYAQEKSQSKALPIGLSQTNCAQVDSASFCTVCQSHPCMAAAHLRTVMFCSFLPSYSKVHADALPALGTEPRRTNEARQPAVFTVCSVIKCALCEIADSPSLPPQQAGVWCARRVRG